jgi:hypothetical protein
MQSKVKMFDAARQPNSQEAVREGVADGRIAWTGPMLLVCARSFLLIAAQGLLALIFFMMHRISAWRSAGDWWVVYGTLVDAVCLLGMRHFTRREGIRLRDLIGPIRMRRGRDFLIGLGFYLLVSPLFFGASVAARWLLRTRGHDPIAFLLHAHHLPIWATVYSFSVWWLIWSPTEEMTYQAYVLPRLQALTGRTWIAVAITGFWWAAQHCALPFVPDWRYIAFRFLAFLPGVLGLMLLYLRTRRLAPLIVAHWPMDIAAAIFTAIY